jgi:Fic family protein
MKIIKDQIVDSSVKTLNIDSTELEILQKALMPNISFNIPKGYYSSTQLSKIMNISKANINKRLNKLIKLKKVHVIYGYVPRSNGRKLQIPYYKILN